VLLGLTRSSASYEFFFTPFNPPNVIFNIIQTPPLFFLIPTAWWRRGWRARWAADRGYALNSCALKIRRVSRCSARTSPAGGRGCSAGLRIASARRPIALVVRLGALIDTTFRLGGPCRSSSPRRGERGVTHRAGDDRMRARRRGGARPQRSRGGWRCRRRSASGRRQRGCARAGRTWRVT